MGVPVSIFGGSHFYISWKRKDKDKVHKLLIERNVKHFSLAEQTPQGINGFIYEALGPYGTSEFSGRVLEGKLSEKDKFGFNLIEAKELCMATSRPDP